MSSPATMQAPLTTATALNGRRLVAGGAAAVGINLAVYLVGDIAGASWVANGQVIGWFMVVFSTVITFTVGGLLTALLARRRAEAARWMAWIGLAFAVVSIPMPFVASSDLLTSVSLAAMHVVAGVAWVVAVLPRARAVEA